MTVSIGSRVIGGGHPAYVIAEIGLNHNGDVDIAKRLIDVAARAGADAVKFQKRTPEISTPEHMRDVPRETPWGTMSYLDYRRRVEFGREEYVAIGDHATLQGLDWFASPWDVPSVEFLENLNVVAHKVASASLTDTELLQALRATGKPVILSTGMSTIAQIDRALDTLGTDRVVLMHATSTYPLEPEEANLRAIATLRDRYPASRSATRAMSADCRSRWPPWRSARSRSSVTSRSTARCGVLIMRPRSSRRASSTSCATSA